MSYAVVRVTREPHCARPLLARYARARAGRAVVLGATWALGAAAQAPEVGASDGAARAPAAAPAAGETTPVPRGAAPAPRSYRGVLGAMYGLAPLLAVGGASALSDADSPGGSIAAVGLALFIPATVHMAHGKPGHGVVSYLEALGATAVGGVVGAMVGGGISSATCDPDEDSDGCGLASLGGMALGAIVGGTLGYAAFAVYDVLANGEVAGERSPPARAALQLWVAPPPPYDLASEQRNEGLQLGATWVW